MSDFADFYQFGGFFNNIVSLFCLAAVATLVMHAVGPRRAGEPPLLRLSERFAWLGIAAGVLGTTFNVIELHSALATVSAELSIQASHSGMSIVPIPLVWSLLCAIPIWTACACLRHRASATV